MTFELKCTTKIQYDGINFANGRFAPIFILIDIKSHICKNFDINLESKYCSSDPPSFQLRMSWCDPIPLPRAFYLPPNGQVLLDICCPPMYDYSMLLLFWNIDDIFNFRFDWMRLFMFGSFANYNLFILFNLYYRWVLIKFRLTYNRLHL